MLRMLIDLLYPRICQACSAKIKGYEKNICDECSKKIKMRRPPFCVTCGRQLHGLPEDLLTCRDCEEEHPFFDRAYSVCLYDDTVKRLVHSFKYRKMTSLKKDLTSLMLDFMKKYNVAKHAELVLSVPMHPKKLFSREINHSDILAKNIAEALNLRYVPHIIRKIKHTPQQTTLERQKRIKNIFGSFSVRNAEPIKNKNLLIVDDLFTTGSTVNECARILKNAGAKSIEVITLARGDGLS